MRFRCARPEDVLPGPSSRRDAEHLSAPQSDRCLQILT